jgi:DNA/RNA-binding domain of Phe-tRNA-synthetase-like protein
MAQEIRITVDSNVLEKLPGLFTKTRIVNGISINETPEEFGKRKSAIFEKWEGKTKKDLDSIKEIIAYRNLQKALGPGPQMLPAVEGMLVRGIFQKRFPKINSAVDAANITSIENLIPIGLFDFDRIKGEIRLRLAGQTDEFIPLAGNGPQKLKPGTPILEDSEKIFSAIGVRDSEATKITASSRNILLVSWGAGGIEEQRVADVLEKCSRLIKGG